MGVFNTDAAVSERMFFGDDLGLARYDRPRYPFLEKLTTKQLGYFWQPQEVDIFKDAKDFKELGKHEKHIFTSNIKRQILLDSVQGRAPVAAFGPICSSPEMETWLQSWTFFETIHSRSYTHIIRNIYPNPSEIFDSITSIPEIAQCADQISLYYDDLILQNCKMAVPSVGMNMGPYEHKRSLWLAMMSVNVLEGIRFYVSFACSWAFAEVKKMEGNAKIIKLIARDENLHLAGTQQILKALIKDDTDFQRIKDETTDECTRMYEQAASQEKSWVKYLFRDGSIIGLNEELLSDYVDWLAYKRMVAVGLVPIGKHRSNPLPWTAKWIGGSEVQNAPQETEITSYITGGIKLDLNETSFQGMKL